MPCSVMADNIVLYAVHGVLMAIGWLVLIPAGIWMSTIGKRRYPESWLCLHRSIMISALLVVLSSAAIAIAITGSHFTTLHAILGPVLNVMLIVQALAGWIISQSSPQRSRPALNKIHKFVGLLLYLGGIVNGLLGMHEYSMKLSCPHAIYMMGVLMGVIVCAEGYLLWAILPAWWDTWCNDPNFEHAAIDEPLLPTQP